MLANIFTKTMRDHWRGVAIGAGSLALMLYFMMAMYREFDLSIYTELPEAFLVLMGIPENADVGSLAIGALFSSYGSWVLVGLAIAAGSAFIAGEESKGTMGLLLGNPKSRTNVLVSKAASMLLLIGLAITFLWGSTFLISGSLDVDIAGLNIGALLFHLFISVIFYGCMAMAIGAWTGNRGGAAGITAGILFVSFFAVGLLPFVEGLEGIAKIFPWYYFNGSEPLLNGINWGHIGILLAGITLFVSVAVIGANRRDLKSQNIWVTLLDRNLDQDRIGAPGTFGYHGIYDVLCYGYSVRSVLQHDA